MAAKVPGKVQVQPAPTVQDARHREFAIRAAIALSLAAFFVALGLIVYLASEVFVLARAGVLVAVLLGAMADFVARHTPIARGWALAMIFWSGWVPSAWSPTARRRTLTSSSAPCRSA